MGCQCQKPDEQINELVAEKNELKNLEQNNNRFYVKNNYNSAENKSQNNNKPEDPFSQYIFEKINELRENPQSFIDLIDEAKKNIQTDEKTGIKVYKTSVKVALYKGEKAFEEAIEILKNTQPMEKLQFNPDFVIDLPNNELDLKSKNYLVDQIKIKIDSGIDVKSFWKDIVNDKESCFILTVVDDSGANAGNKREDILNKDNKYIGISTAKIGRSFACYIVLG